MNKTTNPEVEDAQGPTGDERRDGTSDRRDVVDRRTGLERRARDEPFKGSDRREGARRSALDRRRGPGKRRTDDRRSAEEGEMTEEQFEFVMAINEYKRVNRRPFPTWTEVLDIIRALGYRRTADPQNINEQTN